MSSSPGMKSLNEIESAIRRINNSRHDFLSEDFLILTDNQNALLVSEQDQDVDIAICLQRSLLEKLDALELPLDFHIDHLSDLSVVVEELSHFQYFCENASRNRVLSPLELEIQAEVDKFSYSLDCLERQNQKELEAAVFHRLFDEFQVGAWVKEEEIPVYEHAHHVARAFCRKLLHLKDDRPSLMQSFYQADLNEKKRTSF